MFEHLQSTPAPQRHEQRQDDAQGNGEPTAGGELEQVGYDEKQRSIIISQKACWRTRLIGDIDKQEGNEEQDCQRPMLVEVDDDGDGIEDGRDHKHGRDSHTVC